MMVNLCCTVFHHHVEYTIHTIRLISGSMCEPQYSINKINKAQRPAICAAQTYIMRRTRDMQAYHLLYFLHVLVLVLLHYFVILELVQNVIIYVSSYSSS